MGTKEKETILKLLELYKEMPYLWDKSHNEYKNKFYRNKGQRLLLEFFKELEPNATLKSMIKKIQNLRTNYIKEHKKVKESHRADADEIYVPTLYYYDAFSFLEAYSEPCQNTRDSLESENNTPDQTQDETLSQSSYISQRKKKKLSPKQEHTTSLENQDKIMTTTETLPYFKNKEEDWEVLGKSIGLQLRDLDKKTLRITQKIISDAIYYASTGELTHNSYIALGPPTTHESPTKSSSDRHKVFHQYHTSFHKSPLKSPSPQNCSHSSSSPSP